MGDEKHIQQLLESNTAVNNWLAIELLQSTLLLDKAAALAYLYDYHLAHHWPVEKSAYNLINIGKYALSTDFLYEQKGIDWFGQAACKLTLTLREGHSTLLETEISPPKISAEDLPLSLVDYKEYAQKMFESVCRKLARLIQ